VIPARNAEETIARALTSVLAQSYRPIEILVVDDASSDRTGPIVESFAEHGVKLLRLAWQKGASGARNAGIFAAEGELVAFLDADDEWLPLKLEKQVAHLLANAECVFVACAAQEFSPDGLDLGDLYQGRKPIAGSDCWKGLLACNTIATPAVLVWRRHLIEAGGFDERLRWGEDQDMWIRLAARGSVGYVDETLVRVHARTNSLSTQVSDAAALRSALDVAEHHIRDQRSRLRSAEIRAILAERLERFGRAQCNENFLRGVPVLVRSACMGYKPLETALFLLSACPPMRRLKTLIRRRSRRIVRTGAS
jgi:glycosyltransferase involved in cell wall biosynthesis